MADLEDAMDVKAPNVGVVPAETLLSYDGLSFLKSIIDGTLPSPPIGQTLGFRLIEAEPNRAVFEGEPSFAHYNPIGTVHAGFAATLLDSAVACAVMTTLAKGEAYTTLEIKINLVRALTKEVGMVAAEGVVLHRGRSIATAEGYLRDHGGKLYAHATTTCIIFAAKGQLSSRAR
jgi:uncharacterized protein (TIGR00369 family)